MAASPLVLSVARAPRWLMPDSCIQPLMTCAWGVCLGVCLGVSYTSCLSRKTDQRRRAGTKHRHPSHLAHIESLGNAHVGYLGHVAEYVFAVGVGLASHKRVEAGQSNWGKQCRLAKVEDWRGCNLATHNCCSANHECRTTTCRGIHWWWWWWWWWIWIRWWCCRLFFWWFLFRWLRWCIRCCS